MRVPLSWLRDFVKVEVSAHELADRLAEAGIEVDGIEELGRALDRIVVAEVIAVERHPHADRLTVCRVRTAADIVQVVCGAPNVRVSARVPYAPPGTCLPDGRRIETADVRGVPSAGMLCSQAELGLGDEASGLWLLDATATPGQSLAAHLGLDDTVLDVAVPPNRGDCLSMFGLAREVGALYGVKVARKAPRLRESGEATASLITVTIEDADGCARYMARCVRGVQVGPSPQWMQRRLQAAGVRPINNIVDVTNYVMLEYGQPLHAFDHDRLPQSQIVVRYAGNQARMQTLDDRERALEPSDLLIASGAEAVAIAGVMGGVNSEVVAETRNVLLESAWFNPSSVRRTARRLALRSEASHRFERIVDIEGVPIALDRAAALLAEIGHGTVTRGVVESYPAPRQVAPIELRIARIEVVLGVEVTRDDAARTLRRLGATVKTAAKGRLVVVPPSYRHDLEREIDLIEEIIRLKGYDCVPPTMPGGATAGGGHTVGSGWESELRRVLAAQGLHEMISLSFASSRSNEVFQGIGIGLAADPVRVLNPIVTDEPELRMSLCPSLVKAAQTNLNHGESSIAAFSVGKVFWSGTEGPTESRRVAAILCGTEPNPGVGRARAFEFLDAKGALENVIDQLSLLEAVTWIRPESGYPAFHPGKCAVALLNGSPLAVVGGLHPEVEAELGVSEPCWLFELDLSRALEYLPPRSIFKELPRYPAVVRDMAIVVGSDFGSVQIIHFAEEWNRAVVERVVLFDQYTGPPIPEGKKSLAYSIAYRAADRTLTDDEVNQLHSRLLADLSAALPIEFR